MSDLNNFEQNIQQRLTAVKERHRTQQQAIRHDMEERARRTATFKSLARHLWDKVVHPRMQKLASQFPHAHLSESAGAMARRCICRFGHVPEYPASTTLEVGLSTDGAVENVIVTYTLEILPIFFQFKGHDQMLVPLDAVSDEAVAAWVEARLLDFIDNYARIHTVDQYKEGNMVVDPVCGMRIDSSAAAASIEYQGKTYYFCVEECRRKFESDPTRYFRQRRT